MEEGKILFGLAVVAVVVSIAAAGFTYYSVSNLATKIVGFATNIGTANLTVESQASVNFSTATISWGNGRVDNGQTTASLTSKATDNVTNGNWTLTTAGGLRLVNIGNTNVSLNITGGKNASDFIGGTGPAYEINVTNVEAGACDNGSWPTDRWVQFNTSRNINCNVFQYITSADEIRIDFNLTVPEDSLQGALGDIITATATAL